MKRTAVAVILGGIAGLAVGYALFGEIAGVRVSVGELLTFGDSSFGGTLRRAVQDIAGISRVRQQILVSGAVGAVVGLVGVVLSGSRSSRSSRRRKR
jgi:hypothetical protein